MVRTNGFWTQGRSGIISVIDLREHDRATSHNVVEALGRALFRDAAGIMMMARKHAAGECAECKL